MQEAFRDVRQFMLIGQPEAVPDSLIQPTCGEHERQLLTDFGAVLLRYSEELKGQNTSLTGFRVRLMLEELGELVQAMGCGDLVQTADGIADLLYVVVGTAITFGMDLPAVWAEVQRSNMAKYPPCPNCEGTGQIGLLREATSGPPIPSLCHQCAGKGRIVVRDAGGKIQKPTGWTPPDIAGVLSGSVESKPQK